MVSVSFDLDNVPGLQLMGGNETREWVDQFPFDDSPQGAGSETNVGPAFDDVSARDFQRRVSQWTLGKSPDTFSAMGPYLVLKDEVPDPHALRISTRIGDEMLQDANTSDMIFTVADIVAYITQLLTLEPGTVVVTGTPSGVGSARKRFLKHGEVVVVSIDKLGELANPVVRK